jgi:ribose 5-phosphate isomerase B
VKIAIGSDYIGYPLKNTIKEFLDNQDLSYTDFGTFKIDTGEYPEYAYKVANAVVKDSYDRGVLIGSTGIGMSITANKIKDIRAALIYDIKSAQASRLYNDANILCIGVEMVAEAKAIDIVNIWLTTSFEGGKHQSRNELISKLTGL